MTEDDNLRVVPCETCGTEGRIIKQCIGYEPGCGHPHHFGERDDGECPVCEGACERLVEVEPITLKDIEEFAS